MWLADLHQKQPSVVFWGDLVLAHNTNTLVKSFTGYPEVFQQMADTDIFLVRTVSVCIMTKTQFPVISALVCQLSPVPSAVTLWRAPLSPPLPLAHTHLVTIYQPHSSLLTSRPSTKPVPPSTQAALEQPPSWNHIHYIPPTPLFLPPSLPSQIARIPPYRYLTASPPLCAGGLFFLLVSH